MKRLLFFAAMLALTAGMMFCNYSVLPADKELFKWGVGSWELW